MIDDVSVITIPGRLAGARKQQLWHSDVEDLFTVKAYTFLTDVDEFSGPLDYIAETHPKGRFAVETAELWKHSFVQDPTPAYSFQAPDELLFKHMPRPVAAPHGTSRDRRPIRCTWPAPRRARASGPAPGRGHLAHCAQPGASVAGPHVSVAVALVPVSLGDQRDTAGRHHTAAAPDREGPAPQARAAHAPVEPELHRLGIEVGIFRRLPYSGLRHLHGKESRDSPESAP